MGTKCCICDKVIMTGCICQRCHNELFNHETEIVKVIASAIELLAEGQLVACDRTRQCAGTASDPLEHETLTINVAELRKAVLICLI